MTTIDTAGGITHDGNGHPHTSDPAVCVAYLRSHSRSIDWEPGDGTRYEVQMIRIAPMHQVVLILNFQTYLDESINSVQKYVCKRALPVGSWAGLRPLLFALGWVPRRVPSDDGLYNSSESVRETEARAHYRGEVTSGTPDEDRADTLLGRQVRAFVSGKLRLPITPEEPTDG